MYWKFMKPNVEHIWLYQCGKQLDEERWKGKSMNLTIEVAYEGTYNLSSWVDDFANVVAEGNIDLILTNSVTARNLNINYNGLKFLK